MYKIDCVMGVGELKLDIIYQKAKESLFLLRQDGGGTVWNVLCNLGADNISVKAFGVCGKDAEGDICVNSLKMFNVDVENVLRSQEQTKKLYITIPEGYLEDESIVFSYTSPVTGEKQTINDDCSWMESLIIPQNTSGLVVIDNLSKANQQFISKINDIDNLKIVLDIGKRGFIKDMESSELIKLLKNIDILQLNEKTADCLMQKFELSAKEVYELLDLEVMILTKGSKGVEFLWKEKDITYYKEYKIVNPVTIVDSCGAGDAFLSNFIKHYIKAANNNKIINENFFEKVFEDGIRLTSKVVSCIGSRGHLYEAKAE